MNIYFDDDSNFVNTCHLKLEQYKEKLKNCSTEKEYNETVKEIYNFLKKIANKPDFFNLKMTDAYYYVFEHANNIIQFTNKKLSTGFIMDVSINNSLLNSITQDDRQIIQSIVNKTRFFLQIITLNFLNGSQETINECNLTNFCELTSKYIKRLCKKRNIDCEFIKIYPGFDENAEFNNGTGYHCFNIITLNGNKYIVDCTYSQFFFKIQNDLNRIGVLNNIGCSAGIYMTLTEERKQVARQMLCDGFIKLSDKTLKHYLDGFALSYRNGLYYENKGKIDYTTDYTADDYRNFLDHKDSQANHESSEYLFLQKRPLKNLNLNFFI